MCSAVFVPLVLQYLLYAYRQIVVFCGSTAARFRSVFQSPSGGSGPSTRESDDTV